MLARPWKQFFQEQIQSWQELDRYRTLRLIESAQDTQVIIEGKEFLVFCSNNYLGLANHPALKEAAIKAVEQYGSGSGASRLISGNMFLHQELEVEIAYLKVCESAIVFPTGYMANVGTITAMVEKGDAVILDKANHASIIDGCRQSGARMLVYEHASEEELENVLKQAAGRYRRILIVTDSIFSMDGDIAPLPRIVELAEEYEALLMVDEAHATGVLGEHGRGAIEHFGLEGRVAVVMGTLSKAVGSLGGFVAGRDLLVDYLRNKARSFIYTTAPPPSVCAASLTGLRLIEQEGWRRQRLLHNVTYIKSRLKNLGFDCDPSPVPIIPIIVGKEKEAIKLSKHLFEQGILIPAIRPPTVPKDECRLRLTVMATHTKEQLDRVVDVLSKS